MSIQDHGVFRGHPVAAEINERSLTAFTKSGEIVHKILGNEDPKPVNIKDKGPDSPEFTPLGRDLLYRFMKTAALFSIDRNSAALLDGFNNLLLVCAHGSDPLETSFMKLTQTYAACRRAATWAMDGALPHPKQCRIFLLKGQGQSATDVLDLGAYGSIMEGPPAIEKNFCYFEPRQPPEQLKQMIAALPPPYSNIINIQLTKLDVGL